MDQIINESYEDSNESESNESKNEIKKMFLQPVLPLLLKEN